MQIRTPPPKASIANETDESGKLHAPSAVRNVTPICEALTAIAPAQGNALEIASGTGQHVLAFAKAMPTIKWQPTEVEHTRMVSIDAYRADSGLSNIAAPILLNATQSGWGGTIAAIDLIVVANLFHLISEAEVSVLLAEAAQALNKDGQLCVYGPFKRDGKLISEGDVSFDAGIRAADPEVGYKDDKWVEAIAKGAGLDFVRAQEMPANNLILIFRKP